VAQGQVVTRVNANGSWVPFPSAQDGTPDAEILTDLEASREPTPNLRQYLTDLELDAHDDLAEI
jgi:hypothetical protein